MAINAYDVDRDWLLQKLPSILDPDDYEIYNTYNEALQHVYVENGRYYKDFYYTDENLDTIAIKVLMTITEVSTGYPDYRLVYKVGKRSLVCQYDLKSEIDNNAKAMGIKFTQDGLDEFTNVVIDNLATSDVISNSVIYDNANKQYSIFKFLDPKGFLYEESSLMQWIFDLCEETYHEVENKYKYRRISRENGTYYISNWDNFCIDDVSGGQTFNGNMSYSGMDADSIYQLIHDIITSDDADVKKVMDCDVVRLAFREPPAPGRRYISFFGYKILNGTINVSNDGETLSCVISHVNMVSFNNYADASVMSKIEVLDQDISISTNFSNDLQSRSYLDRYGLQNTSLATSLYSYHFDSIGFSGELKPYDIIGTVPDGTHSPSELYPDWVETDDHLIPLSDNDPDRNDPQYYWIGYPGIKPFRVRVGVKLPTPPPTDNPSDVPTKPNVHGLQTVQGLFKVYKLSLGHVNALGRWLWDANGVNLGKIKQIWNNDPMDSIIGLHQLYFDPDTNHEHSIVLGNVDTEIAGTESDPVYVVDDRYQQLECGFKYIPRYFNDVRDYQTKISIYLPFIGIRELDTNEVMGSVITVSYLIDALTGDCTATICLNRDKPGGGRLSDNKCLYMFNGNCSAPLPLTSADKSRLYQNIANIGKGVVKTLTGNIGGGIGDVLSSGVDMATTHQVNIEKSGNLGGNYGAMGFKKPYLIIEKPLPHDASERGKFIGKPCNASLRVGDINGYCEFSGIHVDTIGSATDSEKDMIMRALQGGVIV